MLNKIIEVGLGYIIGVIICFIWLKISESNFSHKRFILSTLTTGIIVFTYNYLLGGI